MSVNPNLWETQNFVDLGNRILMKIRLIKYRWDQYRPEKLKWKFGKCSKPRNHKTQSHKQTQNETPRNQYTFFIFN